SCGESFLRWEGQCRNCGAWNSLVETLVREPARPTARVAAGDGTAATPVALAKLGDLGDLGGARLPSGIGELDRVLGGGLVPGSVVLVGGEPGIGKSTLLLQTASAIATESAPDGWVLYASGE